MKITAQLLRSRAQKPLQICEVLDLSNLGVESIDKLQSCPKLKILSLFGNSIDYVSGLDCCCQLWKLDLSNNDIKNIDGLQRFVALGTLILANNSLSWGELAKLRHMHILDLSLHGNPQLEKDPHYRIHVIDSLPNIWMLDGRIITSTERVQVQQFFEDSALTEKPVRHKMSKELFTPTTMKQIQVTGVFGERTDHLMRRFPVNASLNIEMDRRRLKYLAYSMQEDVCLEAKYNKRIGQLISRNKTFLEDLLADRTINRVRCNMMLLLLVASLEFAIPIQLMQETITCTRLDQVGDTDVMALFLLPREVRCLIVSLLLSAVKVDKDTGEDGGLYDKLYLCLYYSVSELIRLSQSLMFSNTNNTRRSCHVFQNSKSLIASEVVQLLCVVPGFFHYLCRDAGIMNLVTISTGDSAIIDKIHKLMKKLEKDGCSEKNILENVSSLIISALQQNTQKAFNTTKDRSNQVKYILNTKMAIPRHTQCTPVVNCDYLLTGRTSPEKQTARLKSGKFERRPFIPIANLGEKVLLGPQNVGRVISVPEPDMILIQMDELPATTGAMIKNTNPEEQFVYVDMAQLYWDKQGGFWRQHGTTGDRITLKKGLDNSKEDVTKNADSSYAVSTGHLHPVLKESADKSKSEIPEPVSARYKKQCNLTLSWKSDVKVNELESKFNNGNNTTFSDSPEMKHNEDETDDQAHDEGCINCMEANLSQQNTKRLSPLDLMESCEYGKQIVAEHLTDSHNAEIAEDVTPEEAPTSHDATSLATLAGSIPEIASASEEPTVKVSPSRRSSLESAYEPELVQCAAETSRPSTAGQGSRSDTASADASSTPALPIEIPQMITEESYRIDQDAESRQTAGDLEMLKQNGNVLRFGSDPSIVNKHDGLGEKGQGSKLSSNVLRTAHVLSYPRPVSAVDSYRIIVARETKYYSPYQSQRMNAWKTSNNKAVSTSSPPPQRPCSPASKASSRRLERRNILKVQQGHQWLGGGRDLHWERQMIRPKTAHTPGWMEGMPQRPRSAAAIRAMRRSKTPNITTPSSIAYDSLFAVDLQSVSLVDGGYNYCSRASPVPGSDNQLPGAKLVSHPFAKYVYIMRERHKLKDSIMCAECLEIHRKQEEELQKILGGENKKLVDKLVAMERCTHTSTCSGCSDQLPVITK